MDVRWAALGDRGRPVYLYEKDRTTKFRQVLWGDYLRIEGEVAGGWLKVKWAPNSPDPPEVYIKKSDTIERRPLEVIFVDVGQGDGAVLITPETGSKERVLVVDAGEGNNMGSFLNGRFGSYRTGFGFHAAVITHPDSDHYWGFRPLFANHKVGFKTVYHNGLVERPVSGTWAKLGGLSPQDPSTGTQYLSQLAVDDAVIQAEFSDPEANGRKMFPQVMFAALENPRIEQFRMLSTAHGQREDGKTYMPGFAPSDGRGYTIEVLGPMVEPGPGGVPRLRRLGDYGETKNGHSVLLKLRYGNFQLLFGGDLNRHAEEFLLAHYAGIDAFPDPGTQAYADMITDASSTFRSDVLKVCHHGSAEVTDAFLAAVNPAAFVISSGDQEGHIHPRPDLLGRLGRFGRGPAPVLLSTELQRSTREREDFKLVGDLERDIGTLAAQPSVELRDSITDRVAELARTNVDVWGAIYLKTDGERLITAFKIEAGSPTKRWFYFEYAFDETGQLVLV